jgi:hypothetical protein
VTPTAGIERDQLMHGCVKVRLRVGVRVRIRASPGPSPSPNPNQAFTDGLLDLITPAALKKVRARVTLTLALTRARTVTRTRTVTVTRTTRTRTRTRALARTLTLTLTRTKLAPRGTPEDELPNELLYLGPDENITPTDINWVRPHPAPRAPCPAHRAPRTAHRAPRTLPRSRPAPGRCSPVHVPGPATLRRACNPKAGLQP